MKTKSITLKLRARSIRTLTPSELRLANGGINDSGCRTASQTSCGGSKVVAPTR